MTAVIHHTIEDCDPFAALSVDARSRRRGDHAFCARLLAVLLHLAYLYRRCVAGSRRGRRDAPAGVLCSILLELVFGGTLVTRCGGGSKCGHRNEPASGFTALSLV